MGKVEKLSTATKLCYNLVLQMERVTEYEQRHYFIITYSDNFICLNRSILFREALDAHVLPLKMEEFQQLNQLFCLNFKEAETCCCHNMKQYAYVRKY